MNRKFIAAAILAMSAGVHADLASDLSRMPATEALSAAVQAQNLPVGQVVAAAVAELGDNSELISLLISTAIQEYPDQAMQIVYDAIIAAPNMSSFIESTALAQFEGDAAAQQAVAQSTQLAQAEIDALGEDVATEVEAESTEVPDAAPAAAVPPPPPPSFSGSDDRPASVSPSA